MSTGDLPGGPGFPGLSMVLAAIGRAQDGEPVDIAALRAALVHAADQMGGLAREVEVAGAERMGAERAEASALATRQLARFIDQLEAVVDQLEVGDVDGAKRAVVEAMNGFAEP